MPTGATLTPSNIQQLIDANFTPPIYKAGLPPSGDRAPGGIYYNGDIYYQPLGVIDTSGAPPDENTVFGLGPVTKVLTTSIFGQQDPSLFSESVASHRPSGFSLTGEEKQITFKELATFTGGMRLPG